MLLGELKHQRLLIVLEEKKDNNFKILILIFEGK
jgi:hypothetical protein